MEFTSGLIRVLDIDIALKTVTIGWNGLESPDGTYTLEMQTGGSTSEWTCLSTTIKGNEVRKKNVDLEAGVQFRVRPGQDGEFAEGPEVKYGSGTKQVSKPTLVRAEAGALTVTWPDVDGAEGYRLRWRAAGMAWTEVGATLKQNRVLKKNLKIGVDHHFSVLPIFPSSSSDATCYIWSPSSDALKPEARLALCPAFKNTFPTSMLQMASSRPSPVPTDILAGKVIALYFSASWCGPCRKFTESSLVPQYRAAQQQGLPFEVVFASCDHSETDQLSYFAKHPWLAIPFDHPSRESLAAHFQVSGIPRLVVLNGEGKVIENNAVQVLSAESIRRWCQS